MTPTVRRYKFPQLEDAAWLRERLEEASIRQVGREVGTSGSVVRAAIRRHRIERPPWRATPLERAQWEPDPAVRYELAARIAAEAKATRAEAQRTLRAAERIMRKARREGASSCSAQTPGPRRGVSGLLPSTRPTSLQSSSIYSPPPPPSLLFSLLPPHSPSSPPPPPFAHRWVRSIGKRAGLGSVDPHMSATGSSWPPWTPGCLYASANRRSSRRSPHDDHL